MVPGKLGVPIDVFLRLTAKIAVRLRPIPQDVLCLVMHQPQDCFQSLHDVGKLTHGIACHTLRLYSVFLRFRVAEVACAQAVPSTRRPIPAWH